MTPKRLKLIFLQLHEFAWTYAKGKQQKGSIHENGPTSAFNLLMSMKN
jgi:hypothetical protein